MRPACARRRAWVSGFTLVELAVVMTVVALLLASLMYTLSAQVEQRNFEETRRRLDQARELLLSFAIVNGRLPCPARSTTLPSGAEVRDVATGRCWDGTVEDYYGGTLAGGVTGGLLPAFTIGYQQVDAAGFAVDAWGNRLRYAVAKSIATSPATCSGAFTNPHWVNAANMKANGIACQPGDLMVCKSATGINWPTSPCGGLANQIMTQGLVVAIVFSTGKNGATSGGTGADEAANLNGGGSVDPVFVSHPPTPSGFANGEFDDQFTWITVGELYGKLIAAGLLP
jgi:prepilin-type N-terminal cleavage/methylation domain-containing protein